MKLPLLIAFCLIAFTCGSAVVELTDATFDDFLKSHSYFFVKFFAPWCGHCKALEPVYEQVAEKLSAENIVLAQVNCDDEKKTCEKYEVNGFPTMKHFKAGNTIEYEGGRDFDTLAKSIRGYSGPAAKTLATAEEFDKFVANAEPSVVGFFSSEKEAKTFMEIADRDFVEIRFGVVFDTELIKSKNEGKSGVISYRKFEKEEPTQIYNGSLDNKTVLEQFAHQTTLPLAGVYNRSLAKKYNLVGLPRLSWISTVDEENDSVGVRYILNRLRNVAKEFGGKLLFTTQHKDGEEVAMIEVKEGRYCVFADEKKYCSDESTFSVDNVKKFAQSYLDGKVDLFIKSEPIPTEETAVKKIVGRTFVKEVMEAKEDVFVKFYAPWCGHCKDLEPIYKELAEKMKKYQSLKIAEIDATNNDFDKVFTVHGYPSLYLLPANDKAHPVKYEGERTVKAMSKWLKKQTDVKKEL